VGNRRHDARAETEEDLISASQRIQSKEAFTFSQTVI
jgi:hypothetical protein